MKKVKCILGTVVLFVFLVWTEAAALRGPSQQQKWELDNTDLGEGHRAAFRSVRKNLRRCVNTGCKWPRSKDGHVYVPYVIDNNYSNDAKAAFVLGLVLFHMTTCIRFIVRSNEPDYLHIRPSREYVSKSRCRSFVGHQGGAQTLDLKYPDCFERSTIQHELLHALGFHHEHNRRDRDRHIRIVWENIKPSARDNFKIRLTLNEETPYDYNSILHYSRLLGSKNGLPTMKTVEKDVEFGTATWMSPSDIERINRVYCSSESL